MEKEKHLPSGLKAALIDMDGVLYDSMSHHARAWHKMFSEIGVNTDPDEFFLYEGMTGGDTINLIIRRELGRDATEEEKKNLYRRKAELFVESGKKEIMEGAGRMLRAFQGLGMKRVLVTGSAQGSLLESLDRDYPGHFPPSLRVTALDVKNGKPDPEPYLRGLSKAGVKAEEAIVVENAPLGVRAGKAAGCFTVAVTTGPIPREEFEKEGADLIFSSMPEFASWLGNILFNPLCEKIEQCVARLAPPTITVVTDTNVLKQVIPSLSGSPSVADAVKVALEPGESQKSLDSVVKIWDELEKVEAGRDSLIINIGGGLITDIGGFAAATFKRGIRYINIPTTLLGAVDAATGGKTGINFHGLKNEIGAFHQPEAVIISATPLQTLPQRELMSGYAEMVKTALIADRNLYISLLDDEKMLTENGALEYAMNRCVEIKEEIVRLDPKEYGLRKVLNFGHTAGHAFESLSFERGWETPHGECVAHGILVELILSYFLKGFAGDEISRYANEFLRPHYRTMAMTCDDIPHIVELMRHDKKNRTSDLPNFTLLSTIGNPEIDCLPSLNDIQNALEVYMDMR